jgi:hypothetical protein
VAAASFSSRSILERLSETLTQSLIRKCMRAWTLMGQCHRKRCSCILMELMPTEPAPLATSTRSAKRGRMLIRSSLKHSKASTSWTTRARPGTSCSTGWRRSRPRLSNPTPYTTYR